MTQPIQGNRPALISAFACYGLWGFMPLLFMGQAAVGFDALEILAHRILWAVPAAILLVVLARQGAMVRAVFAQPRTLMWLAASTTLIAINWGLYVWATTHQATLEASLGYYINPLLNMVIGLWLFRERIDRLGWIAIALAAVGVAVQTAALGRLPWIALTLAFSFATYGVIRKRAPVEAASQTRVRGWAKTARTIAPCRARSTSSTAAGTAHRMRCARISSASNPTAACPMKSRGMKPHSP